MYEVIIITGSIERRLATFGDKVAAQRHIKIVNEVMKKHGYKDVVYDITIREITDKMY